MGELLPFRRRPYDHEDAPDAIVELLRENALLRAKVRVYERSLAVFMLVGGIVCLLTQNTRTYPNQALIVLGVGLVVAAGVVWIDAGRASS